jgi:hypothetical protein
MPTSPPIDVGQTPVFDVQLQALAETSDGNGVGGQSDLELTNGTADMDVDIASGSGIYNSTETSLGSSTTKTLSTGDANDDRWDLIAVDVSTGSVVVREGTPASAPEPPRLQSDEILLGVVYVAAGTTALDNSDVVDWRLLGGVADHDHSESVVSTVPNAGLTNSALTVAGNSVSLGGSTGVDYVDLGDTGASFPIPNGDLSHSSVTVAGNSVSLGASTTVDLADLANAPHSALDDTPSEAHHAAHEHPGDQQATSDITDTQSNTVYSYSDEWVPRPQVDDERVTTGAVTANTTTSGEEILLVDSSGGAVTITLASADLATGNVVTVVDVGGAARSNAITIDTGGGEGIDGSTSITVDTDYGATVVVGDAGSGQWYTAGGGGGAALTVQDDSSTVEDPVDTLDAQAGLQATSPTTGEAELAYEHREVFEGRESGTVSDTNQGILVIDHLADGEAVEVYKAALTLATGEAAPSGLNLELVTLDNAGSFTSWATLISGDGSTVYDDETGSPLGSYTNSSGGGQTIGVLVDNATGSARDMMAAAEGVTGQ